MPSQKLNFFLSFFNRFFSGAQNCWSHALCRHYAKKQIAHTRPHKHTHKLNSTKDAHNKSKKYVGMRRMGNCLIPPRYCGSRGGLMVSALVSGSSGPGSSPGRGHSWARHFTLTVPLSTQVYEWVPAKLMLGVTLRWTSIPSRGE